jgi:hypothetical protein
MTNPAPKNDLPPEITDAMEAAGFSPRAATLLQIIEEFKEAKAAASAATARVAKLERDAEIMWPLKMIVPLKIRYEDARRAADAGRLKATKVGGRWFCTEADMARWAPTSRRGQRER